MPLQQEVRFIGTPWFPSLSITGAPDLSTYTVTYYVRNSLTSITDLVGPIAATANTGGILRATVDNVTTGALSAGIYYEFFKCVLGSVERIFERRIFVQVAQTSGAALVNTFDTTRDDIITAALRKCAVIAQGDLPDPEQITEGAKALDWMVKHLQATTELRWNIVQRSEAMPIGTSTLTLSNSGDLIDIYNVFIRDSDGLDQQIRLVDSNFFEQQYNNKSTDTLKPAIACAQFDRDTGTNEASVTLTFYPINPDAYTVYYRALVKQANAGNGTDVQVWDELWMDVLVYGLASRLADEYALSVERCTYLHQKYTGLLEEAQRKSRSTKDTFFLYPV